MSNPHHTNLLAKLREHSEIIDVIGLGDVSLPLTVTAAGCGFETIGIGIDPGKVGPACCLRDFPGPILRYIRGSRGVRKPDRHDARAHNEFPRDRNF